MPGNRKGGRIYCDVSHFFARLRVANVNDQIFAGRRQQPAIVTERNRSYGPIETGKNTQTCQLVGVPQRNQRIGRTGCKVFSRRIEFDANACARMCLQHVLHFQIRIVQYVNASLSIGQKEKIAVVVPGDFVHLKVELFFGTNFVRSRIDECDQVLFVANRNGVSVGRPSYVDILTFGIDDGGTFSDAYVPDANGFVTAGRAQQIGHRCVPTQLIDGAGVSTECCVLGEAITFQRENGHRFVERTGRQPASVTIPSDRMNLIFLGYIFIFFYYFNEILR